MAGYRQTETGSTVTDHSFEINAMRVALVMMKDNEVLRAALETSGYNPDEFLIMNPKYRALLEAASEAAIALLEVHDATGLSLDDWTPVANLVNLMLGDLGPFLPNGV